MIIDIIGPGAIGRLVALALPDHCVVRLRHPRWHQPEPAELSDDTGRSRNVTALPLTDPASISAAIVTTKAAQAVPAVKAVLPAMASHSELLLLHNGLGPQDDIARLLEARSDIGLRVGVTAQGAVRVGPDPLAAGWRLSLRHTGNGPTSLGPWTDQCTLTELGQTLLDSDLRATWLNSSLAVRQQVWTKLIVNCAINPLTAVLQVRNGELLSADAEAQWRPVVAEATAVAQGEGLDLNPNDMIDQTRQVMRQTRHNESSMYQDVRNHRPTEVAFILDPVIRHADQHGIPVPALRELRRRLAKVTQE